MIPQYVAAALVSENKVLAHPGERRLDPDERRPGGSRLDGERRRRSTCWQVLANGERAIAIELLAAAQGVEFLAPLEPGAGTRAAHDAIRELSPRASSRTARSRADIERVAGAIRDGALQAAVEAQIGELA